MRRTLDLSRHSLHGDTSADMRDRLSFVTPAAQWAYAVSLPFEGAAAFVLDIEAECRDGALGIGCVTPDLTAYVSGEVTVPAGAGRRSVKVLVEEGTGSAVLVARNVSASGERSSGALHGVVIRPLSDISAVDLKRLRASRHAYWHYSYDLGDGVQVEATLPGVMGQHFLAREIFNGLFSRNFGSLAGKRILDAACCSGFHTFDLARHGARVVGIDIDGAGIEQAKLVQSCLAEPSARTVQFQQADLLSYQAERPFDLFLCSGLFYHLRDPVGGAKRLYDLVTEGGVIHSCVAEGDGDFMVLADAAKYICCFQGEFSFVPSASMLEKILRYVGFEVERFSAAELAPPGRIDALAPHYADLFRRNVAYYVVKK